MKNDIEQLLIDQLSIWETAHNNFEALKQVKTKELDVNGALYKVQFNPARIVSSAAKVDAKSIQERKCFLCAENRPTVQEGIKFEPNGSDRPYTILVNPFPIFPKHFTIPLNEHQPQLIDGRFGDMLTLAETMSDYVIFYNGPKCGASAPDHFHFQAGNKGFLPLEKNWRKHIQETVIEEDTTKVYKINYAFPAFVIETADKTQCINHFERIYQQLAIKEGEQEPMMNILTWYQSSPSENRETGSYSSIIIPRSKHRPDCYFAEGDENILISPASVDLGGVFITPLEKDFEKITADDIQSILDEIVLTV